MLTKNRLKEINGCITLIGESGTGKSSLAKEIHRESKLKGYKFLQVNICTLNQNLFESEIFGHVKGSFTGASIDKKGLLEEVGYGTLFIDEISDLDTSFQAKLLTVLEEKTYLKVGSTTSQKFYGRIIFASNTELEELVEKQKMRFDFYQRIKTFTYKIPSLKEIKNKRDVINKIFDDKKIEHQNFDIQLSIEALKSLVNYDYPGNYRELHGILEHICVLGSGIVNKEELPLKKDYKHSSDLYYDALEVFEKEFILKSLRKNEYGVNKTSEMIKISKVTLISKIKKYDINIKELKLTVKEAS